MGKSYKGNQSYRPTAPRQNQIEPGFLFRENKGSLDFQEIAHGQVVWEFFLGGHRSLQALILFSTVKELHLAEA